MDSVSSSFWSSASALWAAQLAHKATILVFSFCVGHRLGAEGVGVMAAVLALTWIGGTLAGLGLPDRALFRGAAEDKSEENCRLHGFFLVTVLLVHLGLWVLGPALSGSDDPELVGFGRGLIFGAGAQCASALGLGWLRGATAVAYEVWATVAAGACLLFGGFVGWPLGWVWAVSGGCFLVGSLVGNVRMNGIVPRLPLPTDISGACIAGVPYLALGLGSWMVGNVDIVLGRVFHAPDSVGALQVGTMAVRGLGLLPWVAATLMLRTLHKTWMAGDRPIPWVWLRNSFALGVLVAGLAWMVMPFLAQGHAMPMASIERSTWMSMLFAPTLYSVIFMVPVAAQWSLRGTMKALAMGIIVQLGVGVSAMGSMEVSSCVVAAGVGQLVTLMWLINTLSSQPKERLEMD